MARHLQRGTGAAVIGRSSSSGGQYAGPGSTLAPPVTRPRHPEPAPSPRRRRTRKRKSTGERVLKWSVLFIAVALVLIGSIYGYLRYRLGQIKTISCTTCTAVAGGAPYNVLLVGSDSRAGNTGAAAQAFGNAQQVGGQRSDTIKILHVDPSSGTARLLSIPRDTY